MAWLSGGFSKRKKITLTGGSSGAQSAYQMKFDVVYDSDMKSDFSDLRFTQLDGTTLLDAWMESHTASTSAVVWVETDTPANTVDADIYVYYGNSGAASDWDIGATFLFGDDFSGASLDTNKWTEEKESGTISIVDSSVKITSAGGGTSDYTTIRSKTTFGTDRIVEAKVKFGDTGNHASTYPGFGFGEDYMDYAGTNRGGGSWILDFYSSNNYLTGINAVELSADKTFHYFSPSIAIHTDWKTYQIIRKSDRAYYERLDDGANAEITADYITTDCYVHVGIARGFNATDIYIDDIRVRKYVANPATYAFGSEESEPSVGHPTMRRWGGIPGMRLTGRNSW